MLVNIQYRVLDDVTHDETHKMELGCVDTILDAKCPLSTGYLGHICILGKCDPSCDLKAHSVSLCYFDNSSFVDHSLHGSYGASASCFSVHSGGVSAHMVQSLMGLILHHMFFYYLQ